VFALESWILYLLTFISSTILLRGFYHSKFFSHLDVPNHRSMHDYPTKKSAGLVFMGLFMISLFYVQIYSKDGSFSLLSQTLPGLMVCLLIGFLDDRYNFSSRRKLFFEILFFIPYVYLFFPDYQVFGFTLPLPHIVFSIVLAGYIIFVTNLCNFMDGLDLYLSLSILSSIGIYFSILHPNPNQAITVLLLVTSILSFLYFNFPPARLFMGDTGSLPLGYMVAILPFLNGNEIPDLSYGFLLIPVFWIDGVFTILIRLKKKENIFRAHREHLYQKITLQKLDKRFTTFIFSLWNLLTIPVYFFLKDSIPLMGIISIILFLNGFLYTILIRKL